MDDHLKVGDLVVAIGRRYSTGKGSRNDVGIIMDIQGEVAKVYWQRSKIRAEVKKQWLTRLVDECVDE